MENSIEEFIKLNKKIWGTEKNIYKKYMVVYVTYSDADILINKLLLAKKLEEKENMGIIVYIDSTIITKELNIVKNICESFNIYKCEILNISKLDLINLFIIGSYNFIKLKFKKDIFEFSFKGISCGEELYDYLLRTIDNLYTIRKIKFHYFKIIVHFLKYFIFAKKIFKKDNIKAFIFIDCDYNRSILAKIALKRNISIYQSIYATNIKYENYRDNKIVSHATSFINSLDLKELKFDELKIEKYMKQRFSGLEETCLDKVAFKNKKIYSKKELYNIYDIPMTSNKKNVIVAAHVFSDAPHVVGKMLYKDYYEWFIETLRILYNNKNINIFVKEHPSAKFYGEKGSIKKILNKYNFKNIYLLPDDFNTLGVFKIMDYVVTCRGSMGMEAASFGIPVFTAGTGYYTGLGIDIVANSVEEYKNNLNNIEKYTRLSVEQQKKARLLLYIFSKLKVNDTSSSVLPKNHFMDKVCTKEEQYRYIVNNLLSGKTLKDSYYKNILNEMLIYCGNRRNK